MLAVLFGLAVAVYVPIARLSDEGNTRSVQDFVQTHGQVQLLGFAGLYVIGLTVRLPPRLTRIGLPLRGCCLSFFVVWSPS
jgi:hypothetical protein